MKKIMIAGFAAVMLFAASCSAQPQSSEENETVLIRANTEGVGEIAMSEDGSTPVFDEEYPATSVFINTAKGSEVAFSARPREDYMFVKWTMNGADYSKEAEIYITADTDMDLIAVFLPSSGYEGEPVSDIKNAKTLADVLALPSFASSTFNNHYVLAFELNGTQYRAVCKLTDEQFRAIFDLDFDDPEYQKKLNELLAPLKIDRIDNLTEMIPSEEELSAYNVRTIGELLDNGWRFSSCNTEDKECSLFHDLFSFAVKYDGTIPQGTEIDETAVRDLKVVSVRYEGIGNISADLEE